MQEYENLLEKAESTSCNYLIEAIWRRYMYEKEQDTIENSKRERVLYFSMRIPRLSDYRERVKDMAVG